MALITIVALAFLPETFRRNLRAHETSSAVPAAERVGA
jgi:hypothetical protein